MINIRKSIRITGRRAGQTSLMLSKVSTVLRRGEKVAFIGCKSPEDVVKRLIEEFDLHSTFEELTRTIDNKNTIIGYNFTMKND